MQLPFSEQQFFAVISDYNRTVWPAQVALALMALGSLALVHWRAPWSSRAILLALAFLWSWMGVVYQLAFFTAINPAAYAFGALFLLGAAAFIWFAWARADVVFVMTRDLQSAIGIGLILYALVAYPLWSSATGHRYPELPTFGLPCPTTIFTVGMLAFVRGQRIWPLFVAPILWSLVGLQAAFLFGVLPDLALAVSCLAAIVLACRSLRHTLQQPVPGQS